MLTAKRRTPSWKITYSSWRYANTWSIVNCYWSAVWPSPWQLGCDRARCLHAIIMKFSLEKKFASVPLSTWLQCNGCSWEWQICHRSLHSVLWFKSTDPLSCLLPVTVALWSLPCASWFLQKVVVQLDQEADQRQKANIMLEGKLGVLRSTLIGQLSQVRQLVIWGVCFCFLHESASRGKLCCAKPLSPALTCSFLKQSKVP